MQHLLHGIVWLLSRLPMGALYALSSALYPLVYTLVRYRRRIVRRNLSQSFPDMSPQELRQTERRFYRWFCDYVVETIKLATITPDELRQRMRFENTELPTRLVREGKSVMLLLGHYCNWEWVSSIPLHMDIHEPDWFPGQVYHPLESAAMDALFLKIRSRMGVHCVAMSQTLRVILRSQQQGIPCMVGFIADQTPRWIDTPTWIDFLHHPDTGFFTGCERIAKRINAAVVYLDLQRERRGYYVGRFRLMTETPREFADFQLTEAYARLLEQTIQRDPACWLWSHNRWKRSREAFEQRSRKATAESTRKS